MPRARSTVLALMTVALACAGCGGPMQPDELKRSIETLESTAVLGWAYCVLAVAAPVLFMWTNGGS